MLLHAHFNALSLRKTKRKFLFLLEKKIAPYIIYYSFIYENVYSII